MRGMLQWGFLGRFTAMEGCWAAKGTVTAASAGADPYAGAQSPPPPEGLSPRLPVVFSSNFRSLLLFQRVQGKIANCINTKE